MKTTPSSFNADIATAEAAKLIWDSAARQIGMPNLSAPAMASDIRPVYGTVWNRAIIDKVTTSRINQVLARIRNSPLPAQEYHRLVAMFLEASHPSNTSPAELWAWRQTAERFRLGSAFGWDPILELCTFLHTKGIWPPSDLGLLPPGQLNPLFDGCPLPKLLRALWSISRPLDSQPATSDYLAPDHTAFAQNSLVKAAKAHAKQFALAGMLRLRTTTKHHLPRAFGRLGPAQQIKVLQASTMAPRILDRCVADAAKANLPEQVRGPLPGMASAFRRYTAFCQLRRIPPFPAAEQTALQRSSVFQQYGHLRELRFSPREMIFPPYTPRPPG